MLGHMAGMVDDRIALKRLLKRVFLSLAGIAGGVMLLVVLVGEPVLGWLLGPQWRVDTAFVAPIALAVAVRACVSPLTTVLITLRRFDLALRWQVSYFVSAALIFSLAAHGLSISHFVLVYAVHEAVFYSLYLLLVRAAVQSPCAASSA
jgi:O-antigen/teichoic acid export membrane protein